MNNNIKIKIPNTPRLLPKDNRAAWFYGYRQAVMKLEEMIVDSIEVMDSSDKARFISKHKRKLHVSYDPENKESLVKPPVRRSYNRKSSIVICCHGQTYLEYRSKSDDYLCTMCGSTGKTKVRI